MADAPGVLRNPIDLVRIRNLSSVSPLGDDGWEIFQGLSQNFTATLEAGEGGVNLTIPQPLQVTFPTPVEIAGVPAVTIPQPLKVEFPTPVKIEGLSGGSSGDIPQPLKVKILDNIIIGDDLWNAQNKVIAAQSKFLRELTDMYTAKIASLPRKNLWTTIRKEIGDEILSKFLGVIVEWLVTLWKGNTAGVIAGEIAEFLTGLGFDIYDTLRILYNGGKTFCDEMQKENEVIKLMKKDDETGYSLYQLRSKIISQHDVSANNMVELIGKTEKQAQDGATTGNLKDIVTALKDLQFNGETIQLPNGTIISRLGKNFALQSNP